MSGLMGSQVDCDLFRFRGKTFIPAAGADGESPFRKSITGSATIAGVGGELNLALDATNEVQAATLHFDDELSYDIDEIQCIELFGKLTYPSANAVVELAFGLASNGVGIADPDNLTDAILFRLQGDGTAAGRKLKGNSIVGAANDLQTSDQLWGDAEELHFKIDLVNEVGVFDDAKSAPKTGKGKIQLLAGSVSDGGAKRDLVDHLFDLSDVSGKLQPVVLLAKNSASAETASLDIREIKVTYNNQ